MKIRKKWKARRGTCPSGVVAPRRDLVSKSRCQHPEVSRQQVSCTNNNGREGGGRVRSGAMALSPGLGAEEELAVLVFSMPNQRTPRILMSSGYGHSFVD